MTERPILFSAPMVRAILADQKTMTRRVVDFTRRSRNGSATSCYGPDGYDVVNRETHTIHRRPWGDPGVIQHYLACPYGVPGDLLWVREKMRVIGRGPVTRRADQIRVRYEADGAESGILPYPERLRGDPKIGKCLAYGGYREASRLTLRVTDVRVERVQEITEADARAEGVHVNPDAPASLTDRSAFDKLWDSLNAKRGHEWDTNPYVWVVSFERTGPPHV